MPFLTETHCHTAEVSACGKMPAAVAVEKYLKSGFTCEISKIAPSMISAILTSRLTPCVGARLILIIFPTLYYLNKEKFISIIQIYQVSNKIKIVNLINSLGQ